MAKGILNVGGGVVSVDASGNFTVETGLIADGTSVFNETGVDVDFRVESDDNANMLFVDGGNDRVGIGIATPKTHLTVDGTVTLKEQADAESDTAAYGQIWVNTATPNELYFTDDAGTDARLNTQYQDGAQVFNESSADVDFRIESNGQANMFFVDGGNDKIGIGTSTPVTDLTIDGTLTLKEQADADADTAAYGQIWVNTATPNELYFTTDAGNDVQITDGTALAGAFDTDAAQTFNDSGADVDFRIESNNEANMFFVDGGTDKVGIGTNAVAAGQGTLTVYGRMQVTRGSGFQTLTTSSWVMGG